MTTFFTHLTESKPMQNPRIMHFYRNAPLKRVRALHLKCTPEKGTSISVIGAPPKKGPSTSQRPCCCRRLKGLLPWRWGQGTGWCARRWCAGMGHPWGQWRQPSPGNQLSTRSSSALLLFQQSRIVSAKHSRGRRLENLEVKIGLLPRPCQAGVVMSHANDSSLHHQ